MLSYFHNKIFQFWKSLFLSIQVRAWSELGISTFLELHLLIMLIGTLFLSLYSSLPHIIILKFSKKFWKTWNCQQLQCNYLNYKYDISLKLRISRVVMTICVSEWVKKVTICEVILFCRDWVRPWFLVKKQMSPIFNFFCKDYLKEGKSH